MGYKDWAVAALDMNASQKIVVNFLVSSVLSSSADGALRTIVALLPLAKTGVKRKLFRHDNKL